MNITSLGSEYGRHYAALDLLNKESLIYSFGVGEDITFDLEVMDKIGCAVYAFDPTPKSTTWIKTQILPEKFKFYAYGLADKDGLLSFSPPPNPDWASYREDAAGSFMFPVKKLGTIKKELGHSARIDFLKLDIEGSEYAVLNDILKNDLNPIQMSVEFHGQPDYIMTWLNNNQTLLALYNVYQYPSNEFFFTLK